MDKPTAAEVGLLLALTEGGLFMHTIADEGVRHILSARPVQVQVPQTMWVGSGGSVAGRQVH
jgi:hypothetical protein